MADTNQKNNTLFSKLQKLFSNKAIVTVDGSGKRKVVDTDDRQRGSSNLVSLRDRYTKLQRGYYGEQMSSQSMAYHQVRRELFRDYDAMDADPVLSSALDIFSDESTLKDEFGDTIKIKTDNSKIKDVLENLFYDVLNVESNLWAWTRNMVKYGDFFLILEISPKKGVINVQPASIYNVERLENTDANNPNYVKFKINYDVNGKTEYENYEIAHFRLLSDTNFLPYGKSQIENARRVWKQLSLMEDAMLIHRIMRAPEKRIFKIDIGNIPPNEVDNYMQKIINRMKKIPFVDRNTGDYNLKYNMQNLTEDFFLPVRGGDSGTSIESLSGLDYSAIEDIEYLRAKLFAALKIPKAYLGYEEDVCISPDTMIPLLSGDVKSVADIITDFENGIVQYVYSLDEATNNIVPGKIEWAGMTRRDADVIKVWLDNEEFIVCTPDHKFLKRNGEWVQAKDLSEGDSLMPLYLGKSTNKFIKDYTTVYNPRDNKYKMVHRVVAEYFGKISKGKVVHHIDFNKWNNNPDNLDCTMNWKQHRDYHITMAQNSNNSHAMELYRQSDEFIENQRRNGALGGALSGKQLGKWVVENGPSNKGNRSGVIKVCKNKNCNKEIYTTVANKNKMYCSRECCYSDETLQLYNTKYNTIDFDVLLEHARTSKSFKDLESRLNVDRNTLNRIFDFHGVDKYDFIYSYMPEALKNKGFINNFKQLEKNHKVVRVELLEHRIDTCDIRIPIYHNFGTAAGVIIHNSGKATIAAEDVRFARTIERIQKTLTSELTKIAIIHLAGLGFEGSDLTDFELSLVNPSTIYEQEKYNLWSEKIRLVNDMKDLRMISKDWIYKNILNMSETEIEEEKTKVVNDLKDIFRYNSIENDGSDPAIEADEDASTDDGGFDSDFPSNDKGGRPREGNTYKTDDHSYGRDPLGSDENSKAIQREGYLNNRSAKKHAKIYGKNSNKAIIYEKNKSKRSFMDDSNLIDD